MMIHLKHNWPAKLLSLLAAIVMWFFIMRDQNPVMEVTIQYLFGFKISILAIS